MNGGGSGGGSSPSPYNTTEAYYNQQRADEAQKAATADAKAQSDTATKRSTFNSQLDQGYNQFLANANSTIAQRGLNPNDFTSQVMNAANTAKLGVADLDPNPGAAFSSSLVDSILSGEQSKRSNQYLNQFNTLAPSGFEKSLIPDSAISPFIDSVLNPQYDAEQTQLNNAKQRGILDDTGYQAALTKLGQDRTTALGSLQSVGQGLLESDRNTLTGAANNARTGAMNYQLGQTYDPNSMYQDILGTSKTQLGNLGGQFSQATSGQKYFDPATYINIGGSAQGSGNQGSYGDILAALTKNKQANDASRGVGTTGAF